MSWTDVKKRKPRREKGLVTSPILWVSRTWYHPQRDLFPNPKTEVELAVYLKDEDSPDEWERKGGFAAPDAYGGPCGYTRLYDVTHWQPLVVPELPDNLAREVK